MKLSIVEGFDRVGKTKMATDLLNRIGEYDRNLFYKPPYAGLELKFDKTKAGWILGYSGLDMLVQSGVSRYNYHMVLDRHIASSWVYNRLYSDGDGVDENVVVADLEVLAKFDKVVHYYICHSNKESAYFIYCATMEKDTHIDRLDQFSDFDEYWAKYLDAYALFVEFYHKFNIPYSELKSVSNQSGYIMEYI